MPKSLQEDIRQSKPFSSLQEEASLSVIRTASALQDASDELFRPHEITSTQYNVLRILRGAGQAGLCRNELRDRMLTRMPDVSRLLDRMEKGGLVERSRETEDRRMVSATITTKGRELLAELDPQIAALNRARLGHMTEHQLTVLVEMLALARDP